MKKFLTKILLIVISFFIFELNVDASANTLADLKKELNALKSQQSSTNATKQKTKNQINSENNKIATAYKDIEQAETDIEVAKKLIDKSNKDIDDSKKTAAAMLVFYEKLGNEKSVLEYVTGASTTTELLMRTQSVSRILSYNQDQINKLEELIVENEQLQVDLVKKEQDLNEKINVYQKTVTSLKSDLSELEEISLDISDQIKAQQELIKYYQSIGCKDDQLLSSCTDIANSTGWVRPLSRGYISSGFGYRTILLNGKYKSSYHSAVDIAGNSGGTKVYGVSNGTVAAIVKKASCGGNQVFYHTRVNGVAYTVQYCHLLDINVKVGDKVTPQTVIGTVGGGGSTIKKNGGWDTCSTGYHLHFAIAKGFYLGGGSEGYSSSSKYTANKIKPPQFPEYGKWFYTRS